MPSRISALDVPERASREILLDVKELVAGYILRVDSRLHIAARRVNAMVVHNKLAQVIVSIRNRFNIGKRL